MKYTILSINDDRKEYKDNIRQVMLEAKIGLQLVETFDAHKRDPLQVLSELGIELHRDPWWAPKRGELGIWLSTMNSWVQCMRIGEPLIVFEDDAKLESSRVEDIHQMAGELPADWDFLTLWVPPNQYYDFSYDVTYDAWGTPTVLGSVAQNDSKYRIGAQHISKAYQGYGAVAIMYSPKGAEKLYDSIIEHGLRAPCDCWLYMMAHNGTVNGYAPMPGLEPVGYDWSQATTIHNTERV